MTSEVKHESISNEINNYFDNLSYTQQYNYDIWITIILIILAISIFLYFFVTNKLQSFKRDWPKYKCNPFFMPFAAIINPSVNLSALESISKNFTQCMDNKNYELGLLVEKPINNAMNSLSGVFDFASEMTSEIQKSILFIFNLLIQLYNFVLQKLSAVINELNLLFISIVNVFGHFLAIVTSFYYMLTLFITNLKLLLLVFVISFFIIPVLVTIILTITLWGFFTAITYKMFYSLPPANIIFIILFAIFLILATVSTILMIIFIFIFIVMSEFVVNVLGQSTPEIPSSEIIDNENSDTENSDS